MTPVIWPATLSVPQCLATSHTTSSVWQKPVGRRGTSSVIDSVSQSLHAALSVFTGDSHCPLRAFSWTIAWNLAIDVCVSRAAGMRVQNSCINVPMFWRYSNTLQTTESVTGESCCICLTSQNQVLLYEIMRRPTSARTWRNLRGPCRLLQKSVTTMTVANRNDLS